LRAPHRDGAHHVQGVVVMHGVAGGTNRTQAGIAVVRQAHDNSRATVAAMFDRVFDQERLFARVSLGGRVYRFAYGLE